MTINNKKKRKIKIKWTVLHHRKEKDKKKLMSFRALLIKTFNNKVNNLTLLGINRQKKS